MQSFLKINENIRKVGWFLLSIILLPFFLVMGLILDFIESRNNRQSK